MEPINYYPLRVISNELRDKLLQKDAKVAKVLCDLASGNRRSAYAYSAEIKACLRGKIPMPFECCPLNPALTGRTVHDGYTLDRLVLEVMPGYYLPVHLYQPEVITDSHPALVIPLGHYIAGVYTPEHQFMCANLAMQGFIVITHDPTGQGEREFFPDKLHRTPKQIEYAATDAHMYAALPLYMLDMPGNLTNFFMWENIRLVDYLCTLDYVDQTRLGVTGQSGGGAMSQYLGVIEDRFSAVSPIQSSGKTLWGVNGGVGDAEQTLYKLNEEMAVEASDLMWGIFPKKLMLNLDIEANNLSHQHLNQEMTRLYSLTGNADDFEMHIANCGHVISAETRQIAYAWFNKIFLGRTGPIEEKNITPLSREELRCFPPGFKTKSAYDVARDMLIKERAAQPNDPTMLRSKLKGVLDAYIDGYTLDITGKTDFILHTEKNRYIQCRLTPGAGDVLKVVIDSQGIVPVGVSELPNMNEFASGFGTDTKEASIRNRGCSPPGAVLHLLPLGLYMADKKDSFDWDAVTIAALSYFFQGKVIFRERLVQILTAIHHALKETGCKSVSFEASRQGGLLALCAALYVKTESITTYQCLKSLDSYFRNIDYAIDESVIMPGLVNICDIPKLAELTGAKVKFIDPLDETMK